MQESLNSILVRIIEDAFGDVPIPEPREELFLDQDEWEGGLPLATEFSDYSSDFDILANKSWREVGDDHESVGFDFLCFSFRRYYLQALLLLPLADGDEPALPGKLALYGSTMEWFCDKLTVRQVMALYSYFLLSAAYHESIKDESPYPQTDYFDREVWWSYLESRL